MALESSPQLQKAMMQQTTLAKRNSIIDYKREPRKYWHSGTQGKV